MKAIAQTEYGCADVLKLTEIEQPAVLEDGVLVRVQAASVNAGDWHLMRGTPFLMRLIFGGLWKPKIQVLGADVAGRVAAVGPNVTQFQPGDAVFGDISDCGLGAFAEYVSVPESALALKPETASFEEAASVPAAAIAALQGLRDSGNLQAGQKVLIRGASGGVGSFAVQIAKAWGAEVTGLCSTPKIDMVRQLGADHIIDYTEVDVTQTGQQYDLILDAAAYRSLFDYLPILKPQGTYVLVGGSTARLFQVLFLGALISKVIRRTVTCLVTKPNQSDLLVLKGLWESGKIAPFIDRCYPLAELPEAIRHLEQRQVQGKVVILI